MCMRFRFSKFDGKGSVVAPISELRLRSPSDGAKSTRGVSVPWKTPSVRTSGTRVRSRFTSSRASYVNIVDSNMAGNNSRGSSMDGSDDSSRAVIRAIIAVIIRAILVMVVRMIIIMTIIVTIIRMVIAMIVGVMIIATVIVNLLNVSFDNLVGDGRR